MDHQELNCLSIAELQDEIRKYNLSRIPKIKTACIELLMNHFKKNSPLQEMMSIQSQEAVGQAQFLDTATQFTVNNETEDIVNNDVNTQNHSAQMFAIMMEQMKKKQEMIDQMNKQQDLMKHMLATLTGRNNLDSVQERSQNIETVTTIRRNHQEKFSAETGNAIKFLKSQIPCFSGTDEDDIELWIEKVEGAANIYDFSQIIILAAATSNLTKIAKEWFDMSSGEVNTSWNIFKKEITDHFQRKVLTSVARRKMEARR